MRDVEEHDVSFSFLDLDKVMINIHTSTKLRSTIAAMLTAISIPPSAYSTEHAEEKPTNEPHFYAATHCFGRYLIDVPSDFKFAHTYAHRAGMIDIMSRSNQHTFDQLVSEREAHFKSKPLNKDGKGWFLDTVVINPKQKIVRFYDQGPSKYVTNLDGYVLAGSTVYKFNSATDSDRLDDGTKWVADTLAKVKERNSNEIPTEPGFCIDGGFVKGNENVSERVNIGMSPADQPAVRINFNTSTPNAVAAGLLAREENVKGFFEDFDKLRRGKRTINGIEGEESLLRTTNDQGKIIHLFTWESTYGRADNRRPAIEIEMSAGGPNNKLASPYSDQEAIELWDNITGTLRLRPGAF